MRAPMAMKARLVALASALFFAAILGTEARARDYEIVVLGSVEEAIRFWESIDFWGEENRAEDLQVPRVITVAINKSWRSEADRVSVAVKKELFYRGLAPVVLFVNESILRDRARLETLAARLKAGDTLDADDIFYLRRLATEYRLIGRAREKAAPTDSKVLSLMDALLARVDMVPPALALGQGAYESGYGTSRFALFGNALFGQWTFGGKGLEPKKKRKSKGNYKVAAYDWPLDSVRAYMRNLNTHRAYAGLRRKRAELRRKGAELSGLALADTLTRYSEQGQTYVDTLKGMIRVNRLDIADRARLRDGPTILLVQAETTTDKSMVEIEIANLRASGRLDEIIESMRLGPD